MLMEKEKTYEIYTDASFDDTIKLEIYAIVVMEEKKVIKVFGKKCKIKVTSSLECEVYAIFQAMNLIATTLLSGEEQKNFLLKTDCISAKEFFTCKGKKFKIFKDNIALYNTMKQMNNKVKQRLKDTGYTFEINHILREDNKIAHKHSYSIFKSLKKKIPKNKKESIIIKRKVFLELLRHIDSNRSKVIIYLFQVSNDENLILKTQKDIASILGISNGAVNKIFKSLISLNILEKIQRGKYLLLL